MCDITASLICDIAIATGILMCDTITAGSPVGDITTSSLICDTAADSLMCDITTGSL